MLSVGLLGATLLVSTTAWSQRVDESALRYYAAQKQTARVEAETRRLQRLHPGWSPPHDLWTANPSKPEDAPLWELFSKAQFETLDLAIAARRAKDPNWQIPSDLARRLRQRDLRASLLADAKAARWTRVVASSSEWLADSDPADIDILWQIAEGFARTRRYDDAQRIFDGILRTSVTPSERIATVQKALALLPIDAAERVINQGRRGAEGRSEFADLAIDVTRARISAVLRDAPGTRPTPDDLNAFRSFALASTDANEAALLAWLALKQNDNAEALTLFKHAIAKDGNETIAHGLAQVLRKLGQLREAEEVAYAWRAASTPNTILYIDILADQLTQPKIAIDAKRLSRYGEVTMQTTSGEGAQALGWYAYNSCQFDAASEWFKRAMGWMPKETTAFGLALTARRLKRSAEVIDIANRYDGLFPQVVALMYPSDGGGIDPCDTRRIDTATPTRPAARALMPLPDAKRTAFVGPRPSEFPIVVAPENPYRAVTSEQPTGRNVASAWRPASAVSQPLDARRVSGVMAMPYERFGKTLLPGIDRSTQPSLSEGAVLQAPRGTLWANDQTARQSAPTIDLSAAESAVTSARRFHP
jgi:tetratricopeptide (TPR) repeat protein